MRRPALYLLLVALVGGALAVQTARAPSTRSTHSAQTTRASRIQARLTATATSVLLRSRFQSLRTGTSWADGSLHGAWRDVYGGYGRVGIVRIDGRKVLQEQPMASTAPGETHASLVVSRRSFGDLNLTVRLETVRQLRTPTPNPWETAWVLWHHTNDTHFYSLVLKPTGWELGKEDPAYPGAQRFLRTGSSPTFPVGRWYTVRVRQVGNRITAWVNGVRLVSFTDTQTPYLHGSVGLYNEDSRVRFRRVLVRSP